jgi:hypothetical protein
VIAKAIHKFREYPKSKRIEVLLSRQPEIFISIRKEPQAALGGEGR